MQDTEEYQDASKAVKSTNSSSERGKRPPRRAAVIARENVNFYHGNLQNGLELRQNRKSAEKAQRILDKEVQTDSDTDSDNDDENELNRSVDDIIKSNDEIFDTTPPKPPKPTPPKYEPVNSPKVEADPPAVPAMRTFGKNQPKAKKAKPDRPVESQKSHNPPGNPVAVTSKPISAVSSIHPSYKLPTAKIARKKPPSISSAPAAVKPEPKPEKSKTSENSAPSTSNGLPPPPPLKKAPKEKLEKSVRREKENKPGKPPKNGTDSAKSDEKSGPKLEEKPPTDTFGHHRVEKIKKMYQNWIVQLRQRRSQN